MQLVIEIDLDKPSPMSLPSYDQQHTQHSLGSQAIWQVYDATEPGSTTSSLKLMDLKRNEQWFKF